MAAYGQACGFPPPPISLHDWGGFRRTGEDYRGEEKRWKPLDSNQLDYKPYAISRLRNPSDRVRVPPPDRSLAHEGGAERVFGCYHAATTTPRTKRYQEDLLVLQVLVFRVA